MYVFDCTIWGFHPLGKPAELTAQYRPNLKSHAVKQKTHVTGPAKTGHVGTRFCLPITFYAIMLWQYCMY